MEGVVEMEHPRAARGRAGELDGGLDGLGSAVGGDHRRDAAGRALQKLLRQDAGQQRDAELREVGRAGLHHGLDRRDHVGMVSSHGEGAVAGEQVEIALAAVVDQVSALAGDPVSVVPQRPHDPPQLRVEVAVVERHLLARPPIEDLAHRLGLWRHGLIFAPGVADTPLAQFRD